MATHIAQQADDMLAAGTIRDDILVWPSGVKSSVAEHIFRILSHHSKERLDLSAAHLEVRPAGQLHG